MANSKVVPKFCCNVDIERAQSKPIALMPARSTYSRYSLMGVLLPQQGFDVAMDQHGDIGLDAGRPL